MIAGSTPCIPQSWGILLKLGGTPKTPVLPRKDISFFRGPDKPVSRVLYPSDTGRTVTIYLGWRLPATSSDLPQGCNEAGRPLPCYSVLHRMGFARHRCHHRSGELLPRHFTLTLPTASRGRAVCFCCTFRMHRFSPAHPGRYPASCPAELGLSSGIAARGHPVYLTPMKSITEGFVSQTAYSNLDLSSLAARTRRSQRCRTHPAGGFGVSPLFNMTCRRVQRELPLVVLPRTD